MRALILFVLVIISGCTVTKRVHQPGYYIEWHRTIHKNSTEVQPSDQAKTGEIEIASTPVTRGSEEINTKNAVVTKDKNDASEIHAVDSLEKVENYRSPKKNEVFASQKPAANTIRDSLTEDEVTEGSNDSLGDFLMIMGILFLSLGFLMILGTIYLSAGLPGLNGLFNALVFSGNGFFVGLLGFILFLIILLLLLTFAMLVAGIGGPMVGLIVGLSMMAFGGLLILLYHLLS